MSHYATPFLVLNLGSEMVYVVAQRLEAQNVSQDKAFIVLNEIIAVLLSRQLMSELMKPQETYSHEAIREIIEDVAQSSVMRLDPTSMNKLWDLITMVFKWQVTLSHDLIKITQRHLYEIETYVTDPETQLQLHRMQTLVENFHKILSQGEKIAMREEVLSWMKSFSVRVSLLLRMGLQNLNGSFVINTSNAVAQRMLKNLGENIYVVTQNGKILEGHHGQEKSPEQQHDVGELQLFVDQMLGEKKPDDLKNKRTFRLCIDESASRFNATHDVVFDKIDATVPDQDNKLKELLEDMNLIGDDLKASSFKDDLLEMIAQED